MSARSSNAPTPHPDFLFVGEHPALDFANTLAVNHGEPLEFLVDGASMLEWLNRSGLTHDHTASLEAGVLERVVELRQAWKVELDSLVHGRNISPAFLEKLNFLLAEETFHEVLDHAGSGFRLTRVTSKQRVLATLARAIAQFLTEANLSYLRRCANTTTCVLYFYDTTKNHRRQWCSTASCGNRHKVAAFRKRQAGRK